jgi:hypothetical protein
LGIAENAIARRRYGGHRHREAGVWSWYVSAANCRVGSMFPAAECVKAARLTYQRPTLGLNSVPGNPEVFPHA